VRVYASTACVAGGLWETLDAYRRAGLRRVELGASDPPGDRLVERLRELGLDYLVHNYFPAPTDEFVLNLASPDGAVLERSRAFVASSLELAAGLGSPLYSVHAGFVADPVGFDGTSFVFPEGGDVRAAEDRFRYSIEAAGARARELGLELLVENNVCTEATRGSLLFQTPEEFEALPDVPILLDTGHLNVSAHTLGFDRRDFARRHGWRVHAVHLHDNDGSRDAHEPAREGSWALDAVRDSAAEYVVVEARFANVERLRDHVEWLSACL